MDNATASESSQKQLALRVALDTMKDRCNLQQKRLSEIEDENLELRERLAQAQQQMPNVQNYSTANGGGGVGENFQLRMQVSELQRQNAQLNSHINMVSAENRKLWSRLSQLAKDESSTKTKDNDQTLTNSQICADDTSSPRGGGGCTNQNLIRSKTFTQHSPNPNLRHKLIAADGVENQDTSLKANGQATTVMVDANGIDEAVNRAAMAMGYLNVEDSATTNQEQDFNVEAKKCMEGLEEMRRAAMKQQQELSCVLELLENTVGKCKCLIEKSERLNNVGYNAKFSVICQKYSQFLIVFKTNFPHSLNSR